jgi:hypothetical protein
MQVKTGLLALCLGMAPLPALANSGEQPGFTMGTPLGANLQPGLYFANFTNYGIANDVAAGHSLGNGIEIPSFIWSTGYNFLGASYAVSAGSGIAEAGITGTSYKVDAFNPIVTPVALSWNLGKSFFVSFNESIFLPVHTKVSIVGAAFEQRVSLSYLGDNWVISANNIFGLTTDSAQGKEPDYYNIDATLAHRFGAWEFGAVGYGSFDLDMTQINATLGKGRAVGVGGLFGYAFNNGIGWTLILSRQVITIGATERLKDDTRLWSTMVIPIWQPASSAPQSITAKY